MYGPPELVYVDWKDTDAPGLILKEFGKRDGWLALYTGHLQATRPLRHSPAHS
jgi:hypothetical protein